MGVFVYVVSVLDAVALFLSEYGHRQGQIIGTGGWRLWFGSMSECMSCGLSFLFSLFSHAHIFSLNFFSSHFMASSFIHVTLRFFSFLYNLIYIVYIYAIIYLI